MTTAAFWDRVAPKYSARPISNMTAYTHTLERSRSYLRDTDRVLEIGCGTGSTALLLAPNAKQIVATDISDEMVRIGRAKAAEQSVQNVSFHTATLEDGTIPGDPYDVVTAYNLLHLAPDTETAIAHISTLLKPGGLFISKTPCLAGKYSLLRPIIAVMRLFGKAPPVSFFRTRWLDAAMARHGFEIIESGNFPKSPPSHFIVARKT